MESIWNTRGTDKTSILGRDHWSGVGYSRYPHWNRVIPADSSSIPAGTPEFQSHSSRIQSFLQESVGHQKYCTCLDFWTILECQIRHIL